MESLIIGGLQGLLNYAGLSFFDKQKLKKLKRKIEEGTASTVQCADAILLLQKQKNPLAEIKACCEQLIDRDKQLQLAYVYLGTTYLHQQLEKRSYSKEELLATEGIAKAKLCLDKAILARDDDKRVDYKWLDDLQVLSQINGMLNYYYGFIHHLEGNEKEALSCKEIGLNQNPNMKGVLPY